MQFHKFHLKNLSYIFILYVVLAIASSTQVYILSYNKANGEVQGINTYNNYLIFKYSHFHLMDGKNLYQPYYPKEHYDLYKYSPTFALFFGCFAYFPDWLGLMLWDLFNILVFFLAIKTLPGLTIKKQALILVLCAVDVMTSLQNCQSNTLLAGLLILGFGLFEKQQYFTAVLCITITFFIKIFGAVALMIFLFYPEKWKVILYAVFWFLVLGLLPLPLIGFHDFFTSYSQYLNLLLADQSMSLGISVIGVLKAWFNLEFSKTLISLGGFAIMCSVLIRFRRYTVYNFRLLFFSALMIWMVIFNHKAESPTFIIATAAIFIWFISVNYSVVNLILICLVLIFTTLSPTDLFPVFIRDNWIEPYYAKAIPCILVWIKMLYDSFTLKEEESIGFPIAEPRSLSGQEG